MTRSWLRLGACLALAGCSSKAVSLSDPPPPGLSIELRENFYGIAASTAQELALAIRTFGPEIGGERVAGATEQNITWDYQIARRGDECRMHVIEVQLSITVTLPEWLNPSSGSPLLVEQWDTFAAAVRRHEEEHRRINFEGGRDVLQKLKSISSQPCGELRREATKVGEASLRRFADRQAKYDRDTDGGRTQGVVWPPPVSSATQSSRQR